ncbi:hypothetical protein PTKIN_Ptkin10aG0018900 [Pterospermum kingtungense]
MATFNLFKTIVVVLFCISLISPCSANNTTTQPRFSDIIIFGDSIVGAGNNNYINTLFKGNNPPYGENYHCHSATGRFSNGKIVPGFLASYLGIKDMVPSFLEPNLSNDELRTGVNVAI